MTIQTLNKPNKELTLIDDSLDRLARGDFATFDGLLTSVEINSQIEGTNVTSYCHFVSLNGNGICRIHDLISFMCYRVINYAIPREAARQAQDKDKKNNTTSNIARLKKEAEKLFTSITNTGEGGELLLYILAEEFLKLPQIITKMDHKTNPEMHFHGVDGVYAGTDLATNKLCLYWGESKIYSDFQQATYQCLQSLAAFLKGEFKDKDGNPLDREYALLHRYLNIDNPDLETAIKRYLDKEDPLHNQMESRGIALIGFDETSYPEKANTKTAEEVHEDLVKQLDARKAYIKKRTKDEGIDTYQMHFFMLPIPSADKFRELFLKELGIQPT